MTIHLNDLSMSIASEIFCQQTVTLVSLLSFLSFLSSLSSLFSSLFSLSFFLSLFSLFTFLNFYWIESKFVGTVNWACWSFVAPFIFFPHFFFFFSTHFCLSLINWFKFISLLSFSLFSFSKVCFNWKNFFGAKAIFCGINHPAVMTCVKLSYCAISWFVFSFFFLSFLFFSVCLSLSFFIFSFNFLI